MHLEHIIFLYNFYNSVNRLCYKIIIVKIIMLRTLSVLIAPLHKSVKVLAQPYQLQLLAKKLEKQNKELHFCEEFKKTKKLPTSFNQKTSENFTLEDAYFYLVNKQKFTAPNKEASETMIRSQELDCFARFVIADQTNSVQALDVQIMLMTYFNESILEMDAVDFIECLKIMSEFDRLVRMKEMNFEKIKLRIKNHEKEIDVNYLEILYRLHQIGMLEMVIDKNSVKTHLRKFSQQINKLNIGIKHLYFLDQLEDALGLHPSNAALKNREKLISKRTASAKTDEELEYNIKILGKYVQFIYLLNIQRLNCQLYMKYLELIKKYATQNENFFITTHQLSNKAIETATIGQFKQILKLRVELELNSIEQLGKLVKRILEFNTEALLALLQYLVEEDVTDYRLWMDLEQGFIQKLHLNSRNWDILKMQQQVNIQTIFKILGYMSINKLGSVSFWRPCHKMVFNIVMDDKSFQKIDQARMSYFILSIYEIFQFQTMPEALEQKLRDMAVISLVNHEWELRQLYKFTKCLTFSKYICPQIWYAIESRLLMMFSHGSASPQKKNTLAMILQYATQMGVGSFKFYQLMKKIGVKKLEPGQFHPKFNKTEVRSYDIDQN